MPRREQAQRPPLATHWMPPERHGGIGEPVACLASTYTFHASLFEDELLPRFLGLRHDLTERESVFVLEREDRLATVTAAVFVDSAQVDGGQTTGRWLQVPVVVKGGCQHAKVTLLVWERLARVIVASANLTTPGYRRNREMAAVFDFFDDEDSSPRELLTDVVDFFGKELLAFSPMPGATRARLEETIDDVRRRVRGWRALPRATDGLPSVSFLPVLPKRTGRPAREALHHLLALWGSGRATNITVMTPFVGDGPEAVGVTIRALLGIPRSRGAHAHLVVGGRPSEEDDSRSVVDLPAWYRAEWTKAWDDEALHVYVVPPRRDDEPNVHRALHAKGILVQSDAHALLMMGSSNFSPHGLGVGRYNIEANVCFVARDPSHVGTLEEAFPVDWSSDLGSDVVWPDEPPLSPEDAPSATRPLPPVFAWATFHDRLGTLTIGLDRSHPFPPTWSVRLPGEGASSLVRGDGSPAIDGDQIELALGAQHTPRRVTTLVVEWTDDSGAALVGRLPTLVAHEDELLAPEELRSLTSDGILDCLLSGRDPFDWIESSRGHPTVVAHDASDPLREIDTSTYTLYRTRRLGRALAMLSRRLLSTTPTITAMRHRLDHDPIGPRMLAEALRRDNERADEDGKVATVFALAELMLCLAHVGHRIDAKGRLGLLRLFFETTRTLEAELDLCDPGGKRRAESLGEYFGAVRAKRDELLAAAVPEASDAD